MPDLVHFIQKALNIRAQTEQTEIELLLEMVTMAEASKDKPNWESIAAAAATSQSAASKYSKTLASFAQTQPPELLHELTRPSVESSNPGSLALSFSQKSQASILGNSNITRCALWQH